VGDLAKNFSRYEFACDCGCGFDAADPDLVAALQRLRNLLGRPVLILSGCRCKAHNRQVGGVRESLHTQGRAADVMVFGKLENLDPERVEDLGLFRLGFKGVGIYKWGLHLDMRKKKTVWKG